jgi:hypothetical protein
MLALSSQQLLPLVISSGAVMAMLVLLAGFLILVVAPAWLVLRVTQKLVPKHRVLRLVLSAVVPLVLLVLVISTSLHHGARGLPQRIVGLPKSTPSGPRESPPPAFPWYPPIPSARIVVPKSAFKGAGTFGALFSHLDQAFDNTGYVEKSYFSVPGGLAVVTRMERIYADGRPESLPTRWELEQYGPPRLSLTEYLQALFTANPGYYRVIVFVVTDHPFGAGEHSVSSDQATSWLATGFNALPEEWQAKLLPNNYTCTALIYEFLLKNGGHPAELVPSNLDAKTHLVKSGLWAALHLP